jgi:drug/metabolite transporter (DMT)-like permease
MSMLSLALWLVNLTLDTTGQLAFKAAARGRTLSTPAHWRAVVSSLWIWIGISCYCIEFLTWLAFVTLMPLSEAVLLASVNIVTVMIAARWIYNETLRPLRTLGILLVAAGVAVVGFGT